VGGCFFLPRKRVFKKARRDRGVIWGVDMGPKNKTPLDIKDRIMVERSSRRSYAKIAEGLNRDAVPTQNGGKWYASTVKNIVDAIIVEKEAEDGTPKEE